MDLTQRKLSKSEWDGIEIPVNKDELEILQLIVNGFSNVQLKVNNTNSIFTQLKIEYNDQIEEFLYANFFADKIKTLVQKYNISFICFTSSRKKTACRAWFDSMEKVEQKTNAYIKTVWNSLSC